MNRTQVAALLVAGALGTGLGACGDREDATKSNNTERGTSNSPETVQAPPAVPLTPTGTQQPEVTQPPAEDSTTIPGQGDEPGTVTEQP